MVLKMKNKEFLERLGFAISGVRYAVLREKSIRFQMMAAVVACVLLLILQPAIYWWAIIFVVIAMILAAEMFNTAIEGLCDYVQPEDDVKIKHIKDVAAGAVLITSVGAIIVGVFLLLDLFG